MAAPTHKWLWLAIAAMVAAPLTAQNGPRFTGGLRLGYRQVNIDTTGVQSKFGQHEQLESGLRLFDLSVQLTPRGLFSKLADTITLEARNLGGDPFETVGLGVHRSGLYDFSYDRRKSAYYYNDLIHPVAESDPDAWNVGDLYRFDFERVTENANLKVWLGPTFKVILGFDRTNREGTGSSPLNFNGHPLVLDRTIKDERREYSVALDLYLDNMTLVLEERFLNYRVTEDRSFSSSSVSPGFLAEPPLSLYRLLSPTEGDGLRHSVRLSAQPSARLMITASAILEDLGQTFYTDEASTGDSISSTMESEMMLGDNNRNLSLVNIDGAYFLGERISLVAAMRQSGLQQSGFLNIQNRHWEMESKAYQGGVQIALSATLRATAGLHQEIRTVDQIGDLTPGQVVLVDYPLTTTGTGLYSDIDWRPRERLSLGANIEFQAYEQPYTSSAPTSRSRLRLRAKLAGQRRWSTSGTYLGQALTNGESGWSSAWHQVALGFRYGRPKLETSADLSYVTIDRLISPYLSAPLPDGTFLPADPSLIHVAQYRSNSLTFSARLEWSPLRTATLGGHLLMYQSLGDDDSWPLSRYDLEAFGEITVLGSFRLKASYRYLDYSENLNHYNDYQGGIAELSLAYAW